MRVFIDANIYLNFFRPSKEELNSLGVLRKNLKKQKINLIFPQVTQDEFFRNLPLIRYRYINELRTLELNVPPYAIVAKNKARAKSIRELVRQIRNELTLLERAYLKRAKELVEQDIKYLIDNSINPGVSIDIFEAAKKRRLVGNPPGKGDSAFHIGDEIVWELLLADYVEDDLVIVSNDSDWKEISVDKGAKPSISAVLKNEWAKKSKYSLSLVSTLGEFINTHLEVSEKVPELEIKAEESIKASDEISIFKNGSLASSSLGSVVSSQPIGSPRVTISGASSTTMLTPSISLTEPTTYVWMCPVCITTHSSLEQYCSGCGTKRP